jgi:hypothetical protein
VAIGIILKGTRWVYTGHTNPTAALTMISPPPLSLFARLIATRCIANIAGHIRSNNTTAPRSVSTGIGEFSQLVHTADLFFQE